MYYQRHVGRGTCQSSHRSNNSINCDDDNLIIKCHKSRFKSNPVVEVEALQCFVARSTKYLAARCPYKRLTEEAQILINMMLLLSKGGVSQRQLLPQNGLDSP